METNKVEVSKNRLSKVLRREQELILLEYAGVDNWIGYDEALEYPDEGVPFEELQDMTDDEIIEKYL